MTEQPSENGMEAIVVSNPQGPDFEFRGTLAHHGDYSDLGSVWIYRTERGRYVLRLIRPALRGRTYCDDARRFESLDELAGYLGSSAGAKRVMEALGRPNRLVID